jgi:hypothetical protein
MAQKVGQVLRLEHDQLAPNGHDGGIADDIPGPEAEAVHDDPLRQRAELFAVHEPSALDAIAPRKDLLAETRQHARRLDEQGVVDGAAPRRPCERPRIDFPGWRHQSGRQALKPAAAGPTT